LPTFKHTGKCGDIIYSLPAIRHFGGGVLYLPEQAPEVPNLYSNMKRLIDQQGIKCQEYAGQLVNIDLDLHRSHRSRGRTNMIQRYYDVFKIYKPIPDTWLHVDGPQPVQGPYSVVNVTPRFRDHSKLDWHRIIMSIPGPVVFVGTQQEHAAFPYIPYLPTTDALDVALAIKYADAVYCNQSMVLSVAQGMGKKYHCEFKPYKTNCYFYTPNENVLK
jgi:hypothetical protein